MLLDFKIIQTDYLYKVHIFHFQEVNMPRAQNKADLLKAAAENYKKLQDFIAGMSQKELETPFDFSSLSKSESHWARDKNLRDVLIHLYEWHNLLFKAIERNEKTPGIKFSFLPEEYNWKT